MKELLEGAAFKGQQVNQDQAVSLILQGAELLNEVTRAREDLQK